MIINKKEKKYFFKILGVSLFLTSFSSFSWIDFRPLYTSNYSVLIASGNITASDIQWDMWNPVNESAGWGGRTMTALATTLGSYKANFYMSSTANQWCPKNTHFTCLDSYSSPCSEAEINTAKIQAAEWVNSILSQNPRLTWSSLYDMGTEPSVPAGLSDVFQTHFQCRDTNPPQNWIRISSHIPYAVNPPVPVDKSVCSLGSDINFNFSSTALDVSGITSTKNLSLICTSGEAQNYQLKLIGNNVTNGRLNFNNGVSAQVSLNGTQVLANGSGIQLNNLKSQDIPVNVTLIGTSSLSGTSNALGVLVLEAQ